MVFIRKIKKGKYTYLAKVENKWVNGKVVQKHLGYVGKEISGKQIRSGTLENTNVTKVSIWAPLLVLDTLAKQIHLAELLGDKGEYLLSMVYAHCIDPKSVHRMEEWYQRTDLHSMLHIQDISEQKLYNALDSIDERDYTLIQKKIFRAVTEKYHLKPKGLFFDVTNVYFYGTECAIAKKGHSKEGGYRPQVQIGLAVTKQEGIPIFHKTYEGNIFDARTLQEFLIGFQELNIEDVTIIWDRGITSAENIGDAKKAGYEVICGLAIKQDVKKKVDELLQTKSEIQLLKNRVRLKETILYCTKQPYTYGNSKGQLVLCFNEEQARINKEKRLDRINNAQMLLRKKKPIPEEIQEYLHTNGSLNEAAITTAQQYDGYSVLFSTKDLPTEEIVKPYFEKDKVEKAFRSLKSVLGLKPIKHWLEERVKAHIFICYISYLLLSLLEHKLQKINVTAIMALDKLSTSYKVHLKNKKTNIEFTKTVTLSQEQQKIIKAIDKNIIIKT